MIDLNIYTSLILSFIIQIISAFIEVISLFAKIHPNFIFLKKMLVLELLVQFIQGSFYINWLINFKNISNITPSRYFDWFFTTPIMLINLIFCLLFFKYRDNNSIDKFNLLNVFNKEFYYIIIVLLCNLLMLLFGYLGTISFIPISLGIFLGFLPFLFYFYFIYIKYAILSKDGYKIFLYFFIFWSLYGFSAILPYKIKNTCYNILDLFSKNFFGLYLSYLIYTYK